MAPRLELQTLLEGITPHVYFQPPSNIQMQFPCIIYGWDAEHAEYAGNRPYVHVKGYQVTVVDRNPDSVLPDLVRELPLCRFDRSFTADGLHHYVYHLFF